MICAIVPAAGRSRRMRTQKLLLPFGATTIIGHVVASLVNSTVQQVYVVAGADGEGMAAKLSCGRVTVVINPDPDSSMLESIRCGLRALPEACTTVVMALGDQPAVTSGLVDELLAAFDATDRRMLVPVHHGRRGHPLVFSTRYTHEVLTGHDDTGLRGLLRRHPEDVLEYEVPAPAVLFDVDYPDDYRRALAKLADVPAADPTESGPRGQADGGEDTDRSSGDGGTESVLDARRQRPPSPGD